METVKGWGSSCSPIENTRRKYVPARTSFSDKPLAVLSLGNAQPGQRAVQKLRTVWAGAVLKGYRNRQVAFAVQGKNIILLLILPALHPQNGWEN